MAELICKNSVKFAENLNVFGLASSTNIFFDVSIRKHVGFFLQASKRKFYWFQQLKMLIALSVLHQRSTPVTETIFHQLHLFHLQFSIGCYFQIFANSSPLRTAPKVNTIKLFIFMFLLFFARFAISIRKWQSIIFSLSLAINSSPSKHTLYA